MVQRAGDAYNRERRYDEDEGEKEEADQKHRGREARGVVGDHRGRKWEGVS